MLSNQILPRNTKQQWAFVMKCPRSLPPHQKEHIELKIWNFVSLLFCLTLIQLMTIVTSFKRDYSFPDLIKIQLFPWCVLGYGSIFLWPAAKNSIEPPTVDQKCRTKAICHKINAQMFTFFWLFLVAQDPSPHQ